MFGWCKRVFKARTKQSCDPNKWGILIQLYERGLIDKELVAGYKGHGASLRCNEYPRCPSCPPPGVYSDEQWAEYAHTIKALTDKEREEFFMARARFPD